VKVIPRVEHLDASVTAPPSKSYSVRALLLGALAEGTTLVTNCLDADDTRYALEAIRTIGFAVDGNFKSGVTIGERVSMSANEVPLFIGNAGTAMRFLTGILAFVPGRFVLDGEQRMRERPIGDLVEVLAKIGAEVEYADREGFPPLRIRGKKMRGGFDVEIAADTSSQFASALMLGGATLPEGITLRLTSVASAPYLDVTASILPAFGASVTRHNEIIRVRGGRLRRDAYAVEGDYSSASYWFAAAAATRGTMRVDGLAWPSAQGDAKFLEILQQMGCQIYASGAPHPAFGHPLPASGERDREAGVRGATRPILAVEGAEVLRGGTFDCNATPDLVPTLAAIAPLASEPVEIVNVANLRVKESDRIATVTEELRRLGARVEERPDSLRIEPGWGSEPVTVETHNDHRIAMAFAIAGLARGGVTIKDEQVVSKSYPRFWKTLDEILSR
jgi:3-phosphoshikimate 1-carboxyvinyltransferase